MEKVTNYAVLKKKDGTSKVYLEITGDKQLLRCQYAEKFIYAVPKCIVPSVLDEQRARKLLETIATGQIKKVLVDPYEIVNWKTKEVHSIVYSFGFKPNSMNEIIGITTIKSVDIQ